ncbi:MAG TPA: sugar transferase [Verrucomicrobiae bacterium]|nr:sugar transferase [Verrucomicrobiae bacterium]
METQGTEFGGHEESGPINGLPGWKRGLDLLLILLLSPAVLLIGAIIAVIIKLGSPGPVLFRQTRIGHRGREFTCFKFRTMRMNAGTETHRLYTQQLMKSCTPMIKLDARNDSRLVPCGVLIRASGLDELPQLLNVLRGDMSIVGPRPCIPYEYEHYEPRHRRRFNAVPGLTGLWQVSGKNRTTFEQMVALDVEYSQRMSLGLDCKIMLKTFSAIWTQFCDVREAKKEAAPATRHTAPLAKTIESVRL